MRIDNRIWPVILKHLENNLTDEESKQLDEWLNSSPENENTLKSVELIWKTTGEPPGNSFFTDKNLEHDWDQIQNKILQKTFAQDQEMEKQQRVHNLRNLKRRQQIQSNILKAAALFLVALTSVFLTLQYSAETDLADYEPVFRVVSTNSGERANVDLGDGTKVVLNSESRIEVPDYFTHSERFVKISGQVFFDVKADEANPFFIEAGDAVIRVIGTSFDVRTYEEDSEIRVVVQNGTVELKSLNDPENAVLVTENHLGSLNRDSGRLNIEEVSDMDLHTGWLEGRLIFRNSPLRHVFSQLERWYGVEIILELDDKSLLENEFSADLKMRSVNNVFEVIAASMDINYTINDDNDLIIVMN